MTPEPYGGMFISRLVAVDAFFDVKDDVFILIRQQHTLDRVSVNLVKPSVTGYLDCHRTFSLSVRLS